MIFFIFYFCFLIVFFFKISYIRENMQYFSFCVHHISLNNLPSSCIILYKLQNVILYRAEQYSTVCIYYIHFIDSLVVRHFSLYILGIANSTGIRLVVKITLRYNVVMSFGQIPSSWIPGSYSKSIFNIFTCIHTIFHSD